MLFKLKNKIFIIFIFLILLYIILFILTEIKINQFKFNIPNKKKIWNRTLLGKKYEQINFLNFTSPIKYNCEYRYKNKTLEISSTDKERLSMSKFFFAMNMVNAEKIAPIFLSELLLTLIQLKEITLNEDSLFVSIFESGSNDKTPEILGKFSLILDNLKINNLIVTNNSYLRKENQRRIDFLSKVRNKAIEPLFTQSTKYNYVIFLNDIYYCSEDIFLLLLHDADLACGFDFDAAEKKFLFFRDIWVTRDILGNYLINDCIISFKGKKCLGNHHLQNTYLQQKDL